MPRKKQRSASQSILDDKPCLKATPLRKSIRKSVLNNKSNGDQNLEINKYSIGTSKEPLKKTNNVSSRCKLRRSAPETTNDGINFKSSVKKESFPLSPANNQYDIGEENKYFLRKSRNCAKISVLTNKSNIFNSKKLLNSKSQIKSKRKTIDLNETDQASKNQIKTNKRKKSINIKSNEPNVDCNSKPKEEMDSVFNASVSMKEESVLQILTQQEFKTQSDVKSSQAKQSEPKNNNDGSSSDSDWEEVQEHNEQNLDDYNPVIPKDGVEITIDGPVFNVRKRKRELDRMEQIRLQVNRKLRELQLNTHKTHLLCLLAHGLYVNEFLNSPILKALALSFLSNDILALTSGRKINKIDTGGIKNIASWFRDSFRFENKQLPFINIKSSLITYFQNQKALSATEYNLMFIVIARTLGFKTRLCVSLYPLTHKAKLLFKKNGNKKRKSIINVKEDSLKDNVSPKVQKKSIKKSRGKKIIQTKTKHTDYQPKKLKSRPKRSIKKNYKISSDESDNDDDKDFDVTKDKNYKMSSDESDIDDEDFEVAKNKNYNVSSDESNDDDDFDVAKENSIIPKETLVRQSIKRSNRNILPTPIEPLYSVSCNVCWCEVYSEPDKIWVPIECSNYIINEPYTIEELLLKPVTYIVAYDNKSYVKDVTRRYCRDYMTLNLKMRADVDWWGKTLEKFTLPNSKQDKEEERNLDDMLINKPLPKTITEFKNHPLYALKRHLLKFEAIYPPDAAPVGFLRGEPIYARDCVCTLQSREKWLKEARVVRIGEEPYKIVKSCKWDRINRKILTDVPHEIFGFWQTIPYEPPTAVGGKVPRNEYGNVDLFKSWMLPKGTVHLQIPGLNRVAKKMDIDCSPAIVGFNINKGFIHPIYDGFVVCQEFKDPLLTAWEEEQEIARKRENEKKEKRILGNWKKLIRGLLIRERIKLKYDVN